MNRPDKPVPALTDDEEMPYGLCVAWPDEDPEAHWPPEDRQRHRARWEDAR